MSLADRIGDLVSVHLRAMLERQILWNEYRAAYEGKFWSAQNVWTRTGVLDRTVLNGGKGDPLPIKVQVNLIRPQIKSFLAGLFYKRPQVTAKAPAVWTARRGRPRKLQRAAGELIQSYIDDWLQRKDVQAISRFAYQLALLYGSSAYKLGLDDGDDITDRIFIDALPPWEVIWDERATSRRTMRYVAHLRQESRDQLVDMFGRDPTKGAKGLALTDFLEQGILPNDADTRDEDYFWLLEFYDLTTGTLHWMWASSVSLNDMVFESILEEPFPFGEPTIIPVVLEHRAEHPLVGIPVIDGLYQKNAEKNLLLSIIANAMRHDAARKRLYRGGILDEDAIEKLNNPYDSEWIEVSGSNVSWDQLFGGLNNPEIGKSLEQYERLLEFARQDERGTADVTQGRTRQGTPLSASEVTLLSQYSESATGLVAQGMDDAVSEVGELILRITAQEVDSLSLMHDGEVHNLKAEVLALPWRLSTTDSGVTPTQRAEDRAQWMQVHPLLLELVTLASGNPGPDGQNTVPDEVSKFAQNAYDYLIERFQLPRSMTWGQLRSMVESEGEGRKTMETEKAQEALNRVVAQFLGSGSQGQPAPGPAPGVNAPLGV